MAGLSLLAQFCSQFSERFGPARKLFRRQGALNQGLAQMLRQLAARAACPALCFAAKLASDGHSLC